MSGNKFKINRIRHNILEVVDFYRGVVLDTFEVECGDSNNWHAIRGRLLRSFGDRGLAGRIVELFDAEMED